MASLVLLVALLALLAVAYAATSVSVRDLCNGDCPLTAEAVTVTPYPPRKGSPATLNVRGSLAGTAVDGGTIITTTYYKVIFWIKGKTTENNTCDLFACPVQPGKVNETITMTVPEELPAGSYKTILEIGDKNGAYIGHFEILFQVSDNDNQPEPALDRELLRVVLGSAKKPRAHIYH